MRFNRFIYLFFLLLFWLLATRSTKYIDGKKKKEISTEESASIRLTLAKGPVIGNFEQGKGGGEGRVDLKGHINLN